jgi:hypothetical protein
MLHFAAPLCEWSKPLLGQTSSEYAANVYQILVEALVSGNATSSMLWPDCRSASAKCRSPASPICAAPGQAADYKGPSPMREASEW